MIICVPCCGLCNRMRVIAEACYLSEKTNQRAFVIWNCISHMTIPHSRLFQLDKKKTHGKVTILPGLSCIGISHPRCFAFKERVFNRLIWEAQKRCDAVVNDQVIREFDRSRDIMELVLGKHKILWYTCSCIGTRDFSVFIPRKKIVSEVERLTNELGLDKNVIGIHIRRTDNVKSIENSPTEKFIALIREALAKNPAQRFYLATDSKEVETQIVDMFGKSVILTFQNKNSSRTDFQGQMDAYTELLLLSKCQEIWGSYYSSYSKIASILGNIKLTVVL